jgi:starch phosphorylase
MEASGTSGMNAAAKGVPGLSVLDGWWTEGHLEGVTGWSTGARVEPSRMYACHAADLDKKLEENVLPCFRETMHVLLE